MSDTIPVSLTQHRRNTMLRSTPQRKRKTVEAYLDELITESEAIEQLGPYGTKEELDLLVAGFLDRGQAGLRVMSLGRRKR